MRYQLSLTTPLYERRAKAIAQIPNFWPLVLEQAPQDIDQYIQPSDSALLLSSLTSLSVTHFEIDVDPRSIAITFEFAPNNTFEDKVLEKKFWYRRAKDGWSGLVSEPVSIQWKKGEDLTGGLLDLVCKAWETEKTGFKGKELSTEQKMLKKKIETTGLGGLSFFAWFGFIGRRISAEESAKAAKAENDKRKARREGSTNGTVDVTNGEDEEDEDEDEDTSLEIFDDGGDLANAISEDLWPDAITYFSKFCTHVRPSKARITNGSVAQAQEQDTVSDADFESDEELDDEEVERPAKKQKSS